MHKMKTVPTFSSYPINVVNRNPILSVKTPETGDKKNVVPMVSDPTKAVIEK